MIIHFYFYIVYRSWPSPWRSFSHVRDIIRRNMDHQVHKNQKVQNYMCLHFLLHQPFYFSKIFYPCFGSKN